MTLERKRSLRCAIYTRKSSEEGLEQSFNSLDAQREACLSYIQSQKHEGWKAVSTQYDDGGYSGGTLIRPAMARLLEDISAGKVDLVVVYKVDRLTRSLSDFARIVEAFDKKGVSFVSVTQSFNTSTSMGRLTLNVLLSFAQFEREVTGERIRDKIAASKKKGMWMGGLVPTGYDLKDRKLVVNEAEAETIRGIFARYLELRSVRALKVALDAEGVVTKIRTTQGVTSGGLPWYRGSLYKLLANPIYIGEVRHRDVSYPGEHEGIVSREIWDQVQQTLAEQANRVGRGDGLKCPSLLVGCLVDDQGSPMVPTHTKREKRRYRYYVTAPSPHESDGTSKGALRIPAHDLEGAVWESLRGFLTSPIQLLAALGEMGGSQTQVLQAGANITQAWNGWSIQERRGWLKGFLRQVVVSQTRLILHLDQVALRGLLGVPSPDFDPADSIHLETEVRFKRGGRGLRFVLPGPERSGDGVDRPLVQAIARGRFWYDQIITGAVKSRGEIAEANGFSAPHVARHIPLAWLAPDIVEAILAGRQPRALSVKKLLEKLPLDWAEQRRVLGFNPVGETA